ncbi:hypothetical protein [Streptomyces sp. NPDC057557]|uniref:hypothetical protein n=1 Tax=Streptomyces sp. NPDC057557 TaxID=3346167 RepID=UPI0036854FA5
MDRRNGTGRNLSLPDICDLCEQPLDEETELLALVDDSSAIHTSDPKMDGKRLVTVCSPDRLTELQRQYAQRPYSGPKLWAGKITRAMRSYPNGIKPKHLRRETGLTDQQIEAAVDWNNERSRRHQTGESGRAEWTGNSATTGELRDSPRRPPVLLSCGAVARGDRLRLVTILLALLGHAARERSRRARWLEKVLDLLLTALKDQGLVKAGGKQRTDSTRVLAHQVLVSPRGQVACRFPQSMVGPRAATACATCAVSSGTFGHGLGCIDISTPHPRQGTPRRPLLS